jgi:trigger factor
LIMKLEKIKDETLEKHFKVTIPAKEVSAAIDGELEKIALTIKMPGFRAGKVPLSIIKKKYGDAVRGEAIESQVKKSIMKVIDDNKFKASARPDIDDLKAEEGKDLSFVIKLNVLPEIKHPDLKKIAIERPVLKVVPKDVDDYINKLVEENPSYTKESKVKAVKNDEVTIDFVGYVDKKAFEGGTMKGHKLVLGSGQFIPGFEDQLIGHKAGDDVKVKVTFPETYHAKDLAGKEAIFETKIHEVNKPEKLEINDALGKKYGFEDLIAFKTDVERILKTSSQDEIFDVVKMRLFDKLEKLLSFDVPSSMLDNEFNMIKKQAGNILKSNKEEDDKKTSKKTKSEEIDDEKYKKIALRRVRIGMFISDYAQKQEIKLDNNDLMAAINKQARMFPENKQFIIDYYTKNAQALEALKGSVLEEKSVTHILSKEIEVKDKEYSMKDMEKFLESELDGEI